MLKKILLFLTLLVLSVIFLISPTPVSAEDPKSVQNFATSYDVTYDIDKDGVATVTEKVSLRNLTSQYYATEFKITIGATQISDVIATDSSGKLETSTEQKGTSTTITIKFNQQIAGIGKLLTWTLQFKSRDFASSQGKVWDVSVPKVVSTSNLESYNLTVSVPSSFGEPTFITPNPKGQGSNGGKMYFNFNKDQLQASGISAEFGSNQLFNFDLTYNLENPNLVPILTNIALPPDTAFQDVIYQRIEPKPINVTVDQDGNYLAWYRLTHKQKISVKIIGSAKLYSSSKAKNVTLSSELVQKYLQADKYWDKDNPIIKSKLKEILGDNPPQTNTDKARLIHRYIANYLKYDSSRLSSTGIERLGAVTALANPASAVCMEYTDLFITLARAAGVPARELDGFAYTSNSKLRPLSLSKDILHSWPEYFDENRGWVMIDPTWESTTGGVDYFSKLDLNHFTFAVKGISSEQPAPAGSYKYLGQDSHDVKVSLTDVDFLGKPQIDTSFDISNPMLAGFPNKLQVKFYNNGNAVALPNNFSVAASQIKILEGTSRNIGPIPPFGFASFDFNTRTTSLFDSFDDTLEVAVAGQKITKSIQVRPFFLFQSFPVAITVIVLVIASLYFTILARFIYRKRLVKK